MIHFRIKKDEDFDRENKTGTPHEYYTYGVVCTEVEIDVLTGENQVTMKSKYFAPIYYKID